MPYKDKETRNAADRERNAKPEAKARRAEFDRTRRLCPEYQAKENDYSREYMRVCRKDPAFRVASNEKTRIYRQQNRERYLAQCAAIRAEKQRRLTALKADKPCADCGNIFPPICMDWDHLPEFEKSFCISKDISKPWGEILKEISKCQLVCANCHRIRTSSRK